MQAATARLSTATSLLRIWTIALVGIGSAMLLARTVAATSIQAGPAGVDEIKPVATRQVLAVCLFGSGILGCGISLELRHIRRRRQRLPSSGLIAVLSLPLIIFSTGVLYFGSAPGCGHPRDSLLQPGLPDLAVVESYDFKAATGGPLVSRSLTFSDGSGDSFNVANRLIAVYEARGWPLEPETPPPSASASMGDWFLSIRPLESGATVTLSHHPSDQRGCFNW